MNLRNIILTGLLVLTLCSVSFAMQQSSMPQPPTINNKVNYLNKFLVDHGYSSMSINTNNGLIYVKGTVDQHLVYFLLDTGSIGASILSDDVSKLNLKPIQIYRKKGESLPTIQ